jgi:hypothetical protein
MLGAEPAAADVLGVGRVGRPHRALANCVTNIVLRLHTDCGARERESSGPLRRVGGAGEWGRAFTAAQDRKGA